MSGPHYNPDTRPKGMGSSRKPFEKPVSSLRVYLKSNHGKWAYAVQHGHKALKQFSVGKTRTKEQAEQMALEWMEQYRKDHNLAKSC